MEVNDQIEKLREALSNKDARAAVEMLRHIEFSLESEYTRRIVESAVRELYLEASSLFISNDWGASEPLLNILASIPQGLMPIVDEHRGRALMLRELLPLLRDKTVFKSLGQSAFVEEEEQEQVYVQRSVRNMPDQKTKQYGPQLPGEV